jgi:hypothetical protein
MLTNATFFKNLAIHATDGELGTVDMISISTMRRGPSATSQ